MGSWKMDNTNNALAKKAQQKGYLPENSDTEQKSILDQRSEKYQKHKENQYELLKQEIINFLNHENSTHSWELDHALDTAFLILSDRYMIRARIPHVPQSADPGMYHHSLIKTECNTIDFLNQEAKHNYDVIQRIDYEKDPELHEKIVQHYLIYKVATKATELLNARNSIRAQKSYQKTHNHLGTT